MGRRILNDALRTMVNAERRGKATANLQPISTVMTSFLRIMKNRGYIKDFQVFDPHRVGKITVELQGRIKDCRALTYRQGIRAKDIEQYRLRMLPTRQWGYVVITTPNGILDHEEAIMRNVGETLLKMLAEDAHTPFTSESPGSETMPISDFHDMDCLSSSGKEEALGRVLSTPAVRNLAKQYGLNINDIRGTGKDGRVLKEDVFSYAGSKDVCKESASISHANAYDVELLKEGKTSSANNVDSESYGDKTIPLRSSPNLKKL